MKYTKLVFKFCEISGKSFYFRGYVEDQTTKKMIEAMESMSGYYKSKGYNVKSLRISFHEGNPGGLFPIDKGIM